MKVIKKFRDKYTGQIYNVGDILDLTKNRIDEILSCGFFVEKHEVSKKIDDSQPTQEIPQIQQNKPKRKRNKK